MSLKWLNLEPEPSNCWLVLLLLVSVLGLDFFVSVSHQCFTFFVLLILLIHFSRKETRSSVHLKVLEVLTEFFKSYKDLYQVLLLLIIKTCLKLCIFSGLARCNYSEELNYSIINWLHYAVVKLLGFTSKLFYFLTVFGWFSRFTLM